MIDRADRNQAALLVRRFAGGRIISDEFDEAIWDMDYDAKDKAIAALSSVHWNEKIPRCQCAMWVLFLQTDNEYRWSPDLWDGSAFLTTAFATLMLFLAPPDNHAAAKVVITIRLWAWYVRLECWIHRRKRAVRTRRAHPFFHAHELQQARQSPRLLNGAFGY